MKKRTEKKIKKPRIVDTSDQDSIPHKRGFWEKLSSTLTIIGLSFALIGGGFAAGRYYEQSQNNLKHNDDIMKYNKDLLKSQEDHEIIVHDLRNQIYELQKELLNNEKVAHE